MTTIDQNLVLIQTISAGASVAVCRQTGGIHDKRGYGKALRDEGFPLLSQWAREEWNDETKSECLRMLQTAVDHGSLPMLLVVSIPLKRNPVLRFQLTQCLTERQQSKLKQLLSCGDIVDPKHNFLEPWRLSL
jgi:hypothetical protein